MRRNSPLTSYPPSAPPFFASCLAEGGDCADGWEDELNVKKALGK